MNRSQRILVAVGLSALAAMAAPYLIRAVVDRQVTSGKIMVLEDRSARPKKDLVLCLIRQPGALKLDVASNDAYSDPNSGLALRVEEHEDYRVVKAWLPQGAALSGDQAAQIKGCVAA